MSSSSRVGTGKAQQRSTATRTARRALGTVDARGKVETREAILLTAAALFGERGYAGTTMREIADRIGIKTASLYYHFASKEDLFLAVSRRGIEEVFCAVRDEIAKLPKCADAAGRIEAAIRAHLSAALASGPFTAANIRCNRQIPAELQERSAEQRRPYERFWRDLIRDGITAGKVSPEIDPAMLSLFIFGFMNWTTDWFARTRWTVDDVACRYTGILFRGIEPRETTKGAGE